MENKLSRLQRFTNSQYGVRFAQWIGHNLPPRNGYAIGTLLANLIARQKHTSLVRAVRLNQWVVSGGALTGDALDARVRAVLQHSAQCLYDLYHSLRDLRRLDGIMPDSDTIRRLIEGSRSPTDGMLILAPHMSNFDALLTALSRRGLRGQILSYPNPTSGYRLQNEMRSRFGMQVTPISTASLLQAVETMRNGGYVYTAVDRPSPRYAAEPLTFFGKPAALPVGYIQLAIDANVPILPVCVHGIAPGHYELLIGDPISMEILPDRKETLRHNAQRVLQRMENFIRRAPEQWLMFYPVWPSLADSVP
ncbi:MAG: hypothetical protein D6755_07145 [Anaerolineae bacterium]|nr:MAG: hypothetical protein D6755_07145 [Anaerolineae bacterium]